MSSKFFSSSADEFQGCDSLVFQNLKIVTVYDFTKTLSSHALALKKLKKQRRTDVIFLTFSSREMTQFGAYLFDFLNRQMYPVWNDLEFLFNPAWRITRCFTYPWCCCIYLQKMCDSDL